MFIPTKSTFIILTLAYLLIVIINRNLRIKFPLIKNSKYFGVFISFLSLVLVLFIIWNFMEVYFGPVNTDLFRR